MKLLLLALLLLLPASARAEIRETSSMAEALAAAQAGDLVALDIDNTLIEPVQTLGSSQWFDNQVARYREQGLDEARASETAVDDFARVNLRTRVRAVEAATPALIRGLQERGIAVIALTARPERLREITGRQLEAVGIRLSVSAEPRFAEPDVAFLGGILFAGVRNNKGVVLQELLQSSGLRVKQVLFVDDKASNTANMDAAFHGSALPLLAFRYGAADERVRSFSRLVADRQWERFLADGTLLSDAEAQAGR